MNKVAVILVTYNGIEYTLDCIDSILESVIKNIFIILVDNASSDGTIEIIKKKYGNTVKILSQKRNLGFAKASNIGAQYAIDNGFDYILLLNNDTVIDKNMIKELLFCANINTVTTPKMYYYSMPNVLWFAGGSVDRIRGYTSHLGLNEKDEGQHDVQKNITFATGCCMLIPTQIIEAIGLFNEKFFMYFEDSDFCLRLLEKGYNICYCPKAKLWHKVSSSSGSGTSKFQVYYTSRNRLFLLRLHREKFSFIAWIYVFTFLFMRGMKGWILKTDAFEAWDGLLDYMKNKMGKHEF